MLRKESVAFLLISIVLLSIDSFSQDVIKILPLGNSITYDQRNADSRPAGDKISYRYKLYSLLTDAGYNFDFIGSYRSGFNYFEDCDNSGFKGIDTENLADLIATGTSVFTGRITAGPYLNYYPADIILLEIGTNDMYAGHYSVAEINNLLNSVDQYEQLSGNPILVIIGTIISKQNYPCGTHPGVNLFNNNLEAMVQTRINNGDKLILTDLECGAGINYYNDMWDELHPNPTGYDKMGQKWFNTIDAINAKPVVFNIPDQQIAEGSNFASINLNTFVSDLDDPDNTIIWTTAATPQNLTVTINASKIATIAPINPEWNGTETVTFIASDQGKYIPKLHFSDQDDVVFTITAVNDPPVISSQKNPVVINEDESYEISPGDLNITDPDDPPTSLSLIVTPGANYDYSGSVITPAANFYGELLINLIVTDGKAQSNTFEFTIQVNQVNDPPVITSIPVITADDYVAYSYKITATDPENQIVTYQKVLSPDWLMFNPSTGVLSGTPKYNDLGEFEVILLATDGSMEARQNFTIYVSDMNDEPGFTTQPDTVARTGVEYIYHFNAIDIDENDNLTFSVLQKPEWLGYNSSSNILSGIPDSFDQGLHPIKIMVTDGRDSTVQAFNLAVRLQTGTYKELLNSVAVYPVPATDFIMISSDEYEIVQTLIYDLNGRLVMSRDLKPGIHDIRLDISDFSSGIYMLKTVTTGGELTMKLLIE